MPIEYEMKYLKEAVERSISQYSQENYAATWFVGIETKVLHMARYNLAELEKNFHDDQRAAMRELIRRGYWVRRIEESEKADEESWVSLVKIHDQTWDRLNLGHHAKCDCRQCGEARDRVSWPEPEPKIVDSKKPKIYIAGPMTGIPNGNWFAFNAKEIQLLSEGWEVVNPARMDAESGIDPDSMGEYDYEDCARRDIEVLVECDAIYMLAGFQFSKGACWERALAKHLGLKRYYEVPRADHEFNKAF
jgi:Domain of unknown function (DUF4406)